MRASDAREVDEKDTQSFLVCLLCLGFGFQPLALSKRGTPTRDCEKSPSFVWFFLFFPSPLSEGCVLSHAHLGVLYSLLANVPLVYFLVFLFILSYPLARFLTRKESNYVTLWTKTRLGPQGRARLMSLCHHCDHFG